MRFRDNVVAPTGMAGTEMMAANDPVNVAPYAAQTAFARLATTDEVASAVLFLADFFDVYRSVVADFSEDERTALFAGNAERFYRI